jgi:membrane protein YdbS with pleckstrin-like domain
MKNNKFRVNIIIIAVMLVFIVVASIGNYMVMAENNMPLTIVNVCSFIALATLTISNLFKK